MNTMVLASFLQLDDFPFHERCIECLLVALIEP